MLLTVLFIPILVWAMAYSRFKEFDSWLSFLWVALTLFVFLLMVLSRLIPDELMLQYSGAAFLALTLGYARALLTLSLLLAVTEPFSTLGIMLWCGALVPVLTVWLIMCLSRRFLPANPFVFLLGPGFVGLFLVYASSAIVCSFFFYWQFEQGSSKLIQQELLVWSLLLASGEAILEGMLITILTVYCPKAVALFDDEFYLTRPM